MKRFKAFILERDMFGVPIGLKYKGKSEFQTFSGGLCSILISVLIAYFTFVELSKVWSN